MTVVFVRRVETAESGPLKLKRKRYSESARALLAYAVRREYGLDVKDYPERQEEGGKPYLEGAPFHFNLSHSGGYAVCALSDSPVGVDIEKILPISLKVMRRFFGKNILSPREQMRTWTHYESYGKMVGCGIPYPLGSEKPCFFKEYEAIDRYFITVCSETNEFAEHVILVEEEKEG